MVGDGRGYNGGGSSGVGDDGGGYGGGGNELVLCVVAVQAVMRRG